jgi:signal transduction histidine kinase
VLLYELLDRDGRRVWASPGVAPGDIVEAPSLARAMLNGEIHRVYRGSNGRWTLRIAEPWRTAAAFLSYNARFLLPYLLIAAPCVLLPVWLSVRNGMKPLQQLASRIAERSPDDLTPTGYAARHRELKPLVHSLDALLLQLRHKVERERAFVQDAAHEMRTPLAVIAAQAHVLAHAPDAAQRMQAQEHLNSAIARASHLGRQLLDLAALDDAQRAAPRLIDLAQWLRQALAQVAPAAIARGIDITLEAPDTLQRSVDVPALESIVHNLVDNALRYGRDGGAVRVELTPDGAGWMLSVRDDGPGVAAEERPRLFERFYRGAGHDAPGSGLGLAIVRQAARVGGGSVAITEGLDGRGIGFAVRMPEPVS